MTKEEALRILDWIPTKGDEVDALEMAIEALEKKPVIVIQLDGLMKRDTMDRFRYGRKIYPRHHKLYR